jgi:WD40 repeat protein
MSTNLTGMLTTNFTKKTTDDMYNIMALVEQNKKTDRTGLTGFFRKSYADNLSSIETLEQLHDTTDAQYKYLLFCKQFLPIYKKCIAHVLPLDICKHIDITYSLINNKIINENCLPSIEIYGKSLNGYKPHLTISNNGHYFSHDIAYKDSHYFSHDITYKLGDSKTKLRNIQTNQEIYSVYASSGDPVVYFSPNNEYCVIKGPFKSYLYNISQRNEHLLNNDTCYGITISNNSQYILIEGRHEMAQSTPTYTLWTLDAQGIPHPTPLKNDLYHSMAVAFHPDNKHIIHNTCRDILNLYTIATQEDKEITSGYDENVYCIKTLTFNSDNTRIIAKTDLNDYGKYGHILFNIENLDNVTSITLPPQSCHKKKYISAMCIPHKNMLTHITNEGRTLELLDENAQVITAHHAKEKTYITTLAVDSTGNYLAIGHSDGTIIIWHLYNVKTHKNEKFKATSNGVIKTLTFGENNLLLSQSTLGKAWDTLEPTPTSGAAILWDIYGNKIIDSKDTIVTSIMSPNGKSIITIELKLIWNDKVLIPNWRKYLYVNVYKLHHHKIKQICKEQKNSLTLTHMFIQNTF